MAYQKKLAPFPERFWTLVDSSGGPDECWPFIRKKSSVRGYGRIAWSGRLWLAHRAAFVLANGIEPKGFVCHTCDNPPCCNPAHLYDGSAATNAADRDRRGRSGAHKRRGELHGRAVLTEQQVREIKRLRAEGSTNREIQLRVPTSRQQISSICNGKTWAHVTL